MKTPLATVTPRQSSPFVTITDADGQGVAQLVAPEHAAELVRRANAFDALALLLARVEAQYKGASETVRENSPVAIAARSARAALGGAS